MELLTIKNNIINHSNLKKVRFFFFHFIYKFFVLCGAVLGLLAALISVFNGDMFDFIKSSLLLVILCILPFVQSEVMLKRFIKLQKEKYGSDQVSIDLIFDNDGIISVEQSTQNKSKIMYKDIKQVIETKEIILFITKAGYTTFFERKNVESNDLEKLKQFFDKQNILWEKSILNIF
ncbi:YcxB family protein [uncultured Catenibacterium sp.]|uniref:YcxB family protein n=1 Tax=uncultured Catenibacterium sp. TaxID=286142 RepID=UPI002591CA27|nr:YcxB family protein [uncultured Catenibacterium sp.]